jgi:hypothetical protein
MPRIRRLALTAAVALAGATAVAAPAPAVTDGTSNTIMYSAAQARSCLIGITAIEFKNTGLGFMDYTDDACMA